MESAGDSSESENVAVRINDAGLGLEKTLANFNAESASMEEWSSTASFSNASNASLDTCPNNKKAFRNLVSQTDRDLLRSHMTLIQDFDPFVCPCDCFIPLIEARGGTDKDATGHRRDSLPIATHIAQQPLAQSCLVYFLDSTIDATADATNSALQRFLQAKARGIIVRVNPGTLSSSAQAELDEMLCALAANGVKIMTHPRTVRLMGAKDSLTKIRHLQCGMSDTQVYYTAESFRQGFCETIVQGPRVMKQNRGSQGEGIWICRLVEAASSASLAPLNAMLELTEANDNHIEYHTVGEFLDFCIKGPRGDCLWTSTSNGRYLDEGIDAMLVNQRFLPRIVEGEIRCLMVGDQLLSIVHKKPSAGGVSATLQSGAVYTTYPPGDPQFATLVDSFRADLPRIMEAFGLQEEPLPLLWTADFIMDYDKHGNDCYYVGEFNCACVGITRDLRLAQEVARVAVASIKPDR